MAAKKKRTEVEWVGGLSPMPGFVTGEGEPFRPEALFWLGADGAVLGHAVGVPGELVGLAAENLRSTIERPMYGAPHVPARVRVASPELAEALRDAHAGIEIVCAPTPELDAVLAGMREHLAQRAAAEQTYLSPGVQPEAVGAFFRAAADLFQVQPWQIVPDDQSLIAVTIEKLGVRDAALSVIGQMGQSLGLLLFSGLDDFAAYLDAADAAERDEDPPIPAHFAVSFERGADLAPGLRREILQHGWEVAGPEAYPWLVAIEEGLMARPATAKEITIAEAIARALPQLLTEKAALRAAWRGGAGVERTIFVATHAGELEVMLRVPLAQAPAEADLLAELLELEQEGDEIDEDARRGLENQLLARFGESPEAKSIQEVGACHFVMDFAASYLGVTIATLEARQLRELLFEIFPRKLSVDASEAGSIIGELRAFYAFLKREFALKQADACLRVLAGEAVERLGAALADSSKFGMAKALIMAGHDAGFDMSSQQGLEAWMRTVQSQPLPASFPLPGQGAPRRPEKRVDARAKKHQRKAARKARKQGR